MPTADRRCAHYQPLRNSASFRVRLSDLFFLEFPNRLPDSFPTDSKNGWPILFFAVFLIRLPTAVTITRMISCLVSLSITPCRTNKPPFDKLPKGGFVGLFNF